MGNWNPQPQYPQNDLEFNRHSSIVLEIQEVKFPHLKSLNLSGNNIRSVENLNQLFFPSLEDLFLGKA